MSEEVLNWALPISMVVFIIGVIAFKICSDIIAERKSAMMGVRDFTIKLEDSSEAAKMLVGYLHGCTEGEKRHCGEWMYAGCDGFSTLWESKDVATLVHCVHKAGGRLVARRVEKKDIECDANTVLEVKKILSDLDIERAKRINRKYRR